LCNKALLTYLLNELDRVLSPLQSSTMVVLLAAPPGETRQYCHNDVFRAECPSGHVILMTSAVYGRMSLGRCVKTDFGFIGCKVDVIEHVTAFFDL